MLIEFSVTNWRSIKERQTLTFLKTAGKELEANSFAMPAQKPLKNPKHLLKSLAVYGPNASGKSNLLKAIQAMEKMVLTSANNQRGDVISVEPFLLDSLSKTEPTTFEIVFIVDHVRYQYGFSATSSRILEEWLFAFPKNVAQTWFTRTWVQSDDSYDWESPALKESDSNKNTIQTMTSENVLFLSLAVQKNFKQLFPVFDWFNETLVFGVRDGIGKHLAGKACIEDGDEVKNQVLRYLKASDLGIYDLKINKEDFAKHLAVLPNELKDAILKDIKNKNLKEEDLVSYDIQTIHQTEEGAFIAFDLDQESTGTKKMLSLVVPWIKAFEKGLVLVVDEFSDNLHPKLVRFLTELFHNPETNPKNAQLLFSTHDTSILDKELFRRDQIYFCEKNRAQATELVCLVEYKVIKDRDNFEVNYLLGRYGALPRLSKLKKGSE